LTILQNKAVLILLLYCYRAQYVSALSISGSFCGFMQHKGNNWKASPFAVEELACWFTVERTGLACSSWAGPQTGHQKAWETGSREGSRRLNCYWWKNTFLSLASESATAKNICEWSVLKHIREKRLKRSRVLILQTGGSSAKVVLDLSSGQFSS